MYAPVLRYAYYGHPYLRGALPKLEVLDLQENGKITDAQALVSALAGGALPSLAVLRFVGTAHLKVTLARTTTPTPTPTPTPNPQPTSRRRARRGLSSSTAS
jgi:hypothetical protein